MTIMTRLVLRCVSLIALGTLSIWGCSSSTPPANENTSAEGGAVAPAIKAQPRAEQALLDDLAVANRILARELAILDVQGHVTARSQTNPNHYYIARFIGPGDVVTSDFIENDLDSKPVDGPRNDQAREIYLHGEIYKARPDVMAVVHAHTQEFVAFGLSSVPLWDGDAALPVFDLRPFNRGRSGIISTPALGKAMSEKLGKSEAVLLWGHGIALGARSIPETITRVEQLRDSARVQQLAIASGATWKPQPHPANDAETERTWAYNRAAVVKQMGGTVLMTAPPRPANPTDPVERAKLDVVLANRILSSDDVGVLGEVGHISVRNPNNPNTYFVAPKVAPGAVKASDVVERDITKAETDTEGLTLDDEIYKAHPEVKAILYARTPEIVAFTGSVPLRASVNGGNFIGEGLPVVNVAGQGSDAIASNAALGGSVAKALDRKGAVLLSGNGFVLTGGSIYNVTGRAYQMRQNAKIQQQAVGLRGRVTYLSALPDPSGGAEGNEGRGRGQGQGPQQNNGAGPQGAPGGQGGQQLGPPEGRDWVYWVGNTTIE
jgi:HCOMODA/2-hydroxy-3-carboxy-muconic semialdehyde decarboxylase